jgi:uncharacterized membrane protein
VEQKRIWEIDLLRAMAIILMVIYHTVYDLNNFANIDIDYNSPFWYWEGKTAALIFILLSGISCGLSRRNTFVTGLKVFGLGMIVTVATYFFLGEYYVRFGILHFLGVCMMLYPMLKRVDNSMLLAIAVVNAILAMPIDNFIVDTPLLLPLGIKHSGFVSADYYPLSPYLSVFILGILAYKNYYYKKQSIFHKAKLNLENKVVSQISKHSLLIYMVHQPIIISIISIIKII